MNEKRKKTSNFLTLPDDCISNLSNYFKSPSTVISLIRTCKSIHNLFHSSSFFGCQNVPFHIGGNFVDSPKFFPQKNANFVKNFSSFFSGDDDYDPEHACAYDGVHVAAYIEKFPNLKKLTLHFSGTSLPLKNTNSLKKLHTLSIHCKNDNTIDLSSIFTHAPNLKVLEIFCAKSQLNSTLPLFFLDHFMSKKTKLKIPHICKSLKTIKIHRSSSHFLRQFSLRTEFPDLENLSIEIAENEVDFFTNMLIHAKNLKTLHIKTVTSSLMKGVMVRDNFFFYLQNLEVFIFEFCGADESVDGFYDVFEDDEGNNIQNDIFTYNFVRKLKKLKKLVVVYNGYVQMKKIDHEVEELIKKIEIVDLCGCGYDRAKKIGSETKFERVSEKEMVLKCKGCTCCDNCKKQFNTKENIPLLCKSCKINYCKDCLGHCKVCNLLLKGNKHECIRCCVDKGCKNCMKLTNSKCFEECDSCKNMFCYHNNNGEVDCIEECSFCCIKKCKGCIKKEKCEFVKCNDCFDGFGNGLFCLECIGSGKIIEGEQSIDSDHDECTHESLIPF